jgi:hypothetical protein
VNVFVLHGSGMLAAITGAQKPACESLALATKDPSEVAFCFVGDNPLGSGWLVDNELPCDRIACWSGTLAEGPDLFAAHPHNWMNPGRESLDAFLDEMVPQLEKAGRRLTLLPHARHVLSDVQGSINLVRERVGTPVEVALAPTHLLTPSMIDVVEDHYTRAFETLAGPAPFLLLQDFVVDEEDPERLRTVPLGEGLLVRSMVLELLKTHWNGEKPLILGPGSLPAQLEWLGAPSD